MRFVIDKKPIHWHIPKKAPVFPKTAPHLFGLLNDAVAGGNGGRGGRGRPDAVSTVGVADQYFGCLQTKEIGLG